MIKFVKKCVFFVIIVLLCLIFSGTGYLTYLDSNSQNAKNYLTEKYEINKKDWYTIKYTEYVYEDITDCNSLWLKKCTDNKDLLYQYTFINKNKDKIIVSEDKFGNYSEEYTGSTPLKEKVPEETTDNNQTNES